MDVFTVAVLRRLSAMTEFESSTRLIHSVPKWSDLRLENLQQIMKVFYLKCV